MGGWRGGQAQAPPPPNTPYAERVGYMYIVTALVATGRTNTTDSRDNSQLKQWTY